MTSELVWSTALSELSALVRGPLAMTSSAARMPQLRWVEGELAIAAGSGALPSPTSRGDLVELLGTGPVTAYLDQAARGLLRVRGAREPQAASESSMRVRRRCLALIAEAAGLEAALPPLVPMPELKEPASPHSRDLLRRALDDQVAEARRTSAYDALVRLRAAVGVVLDTGARVGELCALTVADLEQELTEVTVRRRPQASGAANAAVEVHGLAPPTRSALRAWLAVRREVIAPLEGSSAALWVSLRANHAPGGALRPPGLPLEPRGMVRAYQRVADHLNTTKAGTDGWEPLPLRMEQLRRSPSLVVG